MPFKLNPITGNLDFYLKDAEEIAYDNSISGLTGTTVQEAIDEVEGKVEASFGNNQLQVVLNSQMFS
jgi:hypothetical protein